MKFAPRPFIFAVFAALSSLLFVAAAEAAPAPAGSYLSSCKNVRATPRVLTARCETRRGGYIETRLNAYRDCRGDIANDNGRLICREPDLSLYENSRYRGRALFVDNDLAQMPRSFNDRASSIRVRRGTWQVCVDWNYGGRCVTVSADVPDLIRLGMNDRISSVRRVVPPPQGSYQQSCREIQFDGRTLTASCRQRFNRYETSSLDVRRCRRGADIENDRGELACEEAGDALDDRGDRDLDRDERDRDNRDRDNRDRDDGNRGDDQSDAAPPPGGSYLKTCRNVRAEDDRLFAECQDRDGKWRRTDLDFGDCPAEIRNDNGRLDCTAPSNIPPTPPTTPQSWPRSNGLPPGSYRQTCRDLSVMGGTLTGECKAKNGIWRTTALILRTCSPGTEIVNDNGVLVCTSVPFVPSSAPPPSQQGNPAWNNAPGTPSGAPSGSSAGAGTAPTSNLNTPPPSPPQGNPPSTGAPAATGGTSSPPAAGTGSPTPITPPAGNTPPPGTTADATPPRAPTPPPTGSYQQSCRNIMVDRGTLKAECKDGIGVWQETSIGLRSCRGAADISNDNGALKCDAPAGGTP